MKSLFAASVTFATPGARMCVVEQEEKLEATLRRAALARPSGFAGAREQHRRWRGALLGNGPPDRGAWSALEVVSLGQVEQAASREWVRLLRKIARPLREAPIEIFHDAPPQHHRKPDFNSLWDARQDVIDSLA